MTSNVSQFRTDASQASPTNVVWDGFTRSLWSHTAPPPEFYPPAPNTLNVEVAIVGAGFAGLSAAIALLERGVEVAVLESRQPGFGASGRNGGHWTITTPSGVVHARRVILATNAYTTDLWPGLRQTVVPLYSMQVATNPLPADVGAQILAGGQSMTDALRLIHYFRRDAEGRFVIGERGPFRDIPHESDTHRVIGVARKMYPALARVEFPYRWAGKVAMTTDHMPHFHRLAPGLSAILGFNGRGVAMATTLGQVLAAACLDDKALTTPFPVTPMHPIRMHSLNMVGVAAMIAYYRVLDQIA